METKKIYYFELVVCSCIIAGFIIARGLLWIRFKNRTEAVVKRQFGLRLRYVHDILLSCGGYIKGKTRAPEVKRVRTYGE